MSQGRLLPSSPLACLCLQAEHRTMAVFILAVIVNSYNTGQVRAGLLLLKPSACSSTPSAGRFLAPFLPPLCSYLSCFYLPFFPHL